ncbi:MAG: multidrug efflux system outer membrane protein, partial [Rickettsiales bacterium]
MKIKNLTILIFLSAVICNLSACHFIPEYSKPEAPVPFSATQKEEKNKKEISNVSWQEYFQSSDLQRIIQLALDNNQDLKTAALNIKIAENNNKIALADLLPQIDGFASRNEQSNVIFPNQRDGGENLSFTQYSAGISLTSFEIDLFGKLRSLNKSALEDFLATKEAKNAIKISLIANVAAAYTQLLLDEKNLEIHQEIKKAEQKRYNFIKSRFNNGIEAEESVLSASINVENAKNNLEIYQSLIVADKNVLMILTGTFFETLDGGSFPKKNKKKANLGDIKINESLLTLTASENLLSRPDIRQAEHNLKSANANIGAARAAFFPSINLTGNIGYASGNLKDLLVSNGWVFMPQINFPIFSGGRNKANLNIANIRKEIQILNYEKAIQIAFSEVLNQ